MNIQEANTLACELLEEHGLIDKEWYFEFDNAKRRFGACKHREKAITLSKHLVELNDVVKVKDVILHEIAHALVGIGHGHDAVWKAKAIEIGCDGKRCYGDETIKPKGDYSATCINCGNTYTKYKKPRVNYWCKCDKKKYNTKSILVWNKLGN